MQRISIQNVTLDVSSLYAQHDGKICIKPKGSRESHLNVDLIYVLIGEFQNAIFISRGVRLLLPGLQIIFSTTSNILQSSFDITFPIIFIWRKSARWRSGLKTKIMTYFHNQYLHAEYLVVVLFIRVGSLKQKYSSGKNKSRLTIDLHTSIHFDLEIPTPPPPLPSNQPNFKTILKTHISALL